MKTIKFILLSFVLFLGLNASAQCFEMSVTPTFSPVSNAQCYLISVELGAETVTISDGFHTDVECTSSCSFVWCYEAGNNSYYNVLIQCQTASAACNQLDGCIVVVGNG